MTEQPKPETGDVYTAAVLDIHRDLNHRIGCGISDSPPFRLAEIERAHVAILRQHLPPQPDVFRFLPALQYVRAFLQTRCEIAKPNGPVESCRTVEAVCAILEAPVIQPDVAKLREACEAVVEPGWWRRNDGVCAICMRNIAHDGHQDQCPVVLAQAALAASGAAKMEAGE